MNRTLKIVPFVLLQTANCTGLDYSICHSEMKKAGRKDKEGVFPKTWVPVYEKHGIKCITACGTTRMAKYMRQFAENTCAGITVKRLIEHISKDASLQKERFVIMTSNHVFAVVEGKIYDRGYVEGGKSVVAIFKLI